MSDKKDITTWPPKAKVAQVDRQTLKRMTPEAVQQAREAGALDDLLAGKQPPAAPAPPIETDSEKVARLLRQGGGK